MFLDKNQSSLFRCEILNGPVSGHNWSFSGCDTSCLASLFRTFTSPIVGEAALEAYLENV